MTATTSWIAFGNRGVPKLIEAISEPGAGDTSLAPKTRTALATLHSLLSSQESKMVCLAKDGAVVPVLTQLLESEDHEVRRQSALILGSLALIFQGRMAISNAQSVAALIALLGKPDDNAGVREAAAAAMLALSSSRDGCSTLMQADRVVATLTLALKDEHMPVMRSSLDALANVLRLDHGVTEALETGITRLLKGLVSPLEVFDEDMTEKALQALWNLSNTPDGKRSAIEEGLLEDLSELMAESRSPNIRRLAAGCTMAITIDKQGKLQSKSCEEPLVELLIDPESDAPTIRDAVGALKNISEYPKARKAIDKYVKTVEADTAFKEMLEKPMFDHKQWPASFRYEHQNVAPGGAAAESEAELRKRWGYPAPFRASQ
ncbi:hypothetical protein AB1Y20_009390 [Prymnesium parvum]|uniref:U-box domain-containing protein n=1 Tax=Prymnesium parvum TaxID=97485 RepID=A0AB34K1B0_PRYPA